MNKLILIISFLSCLFINSQETFHVLHIEGKIVYDTITKPLVVGDEIIGNPKFKFSSENDKTVMLSNLRGRMILFSNQKTDEKISELKYYFKSNILPVKEYTATRSGNDNVTLLFFKKNALYLPKKIKAFKIPDDNKSFYLLEYSSKDKTFQTKLDISRHGFLELNSNTIPLSIENLKANDIEKIHLKYYEHSSNEFIKINSLVFKYYQIEDIYKELSFYKKRLQKQSLKTSEINLELLDFLHNSYSSDLNLKDFDIK